MLKHTNYINGFYENRGKKDDSGMKFSTKELYKK